LIATWSVSIACLPAAIVWSDDFEDDIPPAAPSRDFSGGAAGQDYVFAGGVNQTNQTSSAGLPSTSFFRTDGEDSGGTANNSTVLMSQFSPFTLGAGQQLKVSYEWRVDSFASSNGTHNPRFILRYANLASQQLTIGFGRNATVNLDTADGVDDLALYASPASSTITSPLTTTAIGLSGGSFAPGFDFGNASATAADNDTHDQFYRIEFTYDFDTGAVVGTATNQTTLESASFNRTMTAGLGFASDATVNTDSIIFANGQAATSTDYFDNVVVEVIPEPSALVIFGCGGLLLGFRRTRSL
jgi:hypothetical protein